jgi:ABC-type bacteriocin/lantibiotic exporters, contain an N-terminal double-glycine peptidase domain
MTKILIQALKFMGRRRYLYLFAIIAMAVLKALLDVVTSFFVKQLYLIMEGRNFADIIPSVGKNIFLGVIIIIIWRYFTIVYNNEAKRATAVIQKAVYQKALKLPFVYYEENAQGSFLSRLSYNIDKASDVYGSRFRRVVTPFISVGVYLIAMFSLNLKMSLLLLLANTMLLIINLSINSPMKRIGEKILVTKQEETGIFLSILQGAKVIRMYEMKDIMKEKYENILAKWGKQQGLRGVLLAVLESFHSGFDLLCSVLFIGIGIIMMNKGSILLGELVAIYVLYTSFNFHFLQIGKYIPELNECLVYMRDLFEFLELEEEKEGNTTIDYLEPLLENESVISFRDVSFGYKEKTPILDNMSVDFESGIMTAITGRTGCGKSTLLKLILGFYPVNSGKIYLYGKGLGEIGWQKVREMIAYVPQEPYLYNVSIAENISYGKLGASTDEIIRAARAANAHEFIMRQQDGYNTIISEGGASLSGGERQRIAIARAILKDAPIIFMDEATSALDNESEKSINDFLSNRYQNKTIIIIAHRPTTIEKAAVQINISKR